MAKYKNCSSVKSYLEAAIRRDIASGIYRAGEVLPAERKLCDKLGISRGTLRTALKTLAGEGLISPLQGSGWKVKGELSKSVAVMFPGGGDPYNVSFYKAVSSSLKPYGYSAVYVPFVKRQL